MATLVSEEGWQIVQGRRKLPRRGCVRCREAKTKCRESKSGSVCVRCLERGLECTPWMQWIQRPYGGLMARHGPATPEFGSGNLSASLSSPIITISDDSSNPRSPILEALIAPLLARYLNDAPVHFGGEQRSNLFQVWQEFIRVKPRPMHCYISLTLDQQQRRLGVLDKNKKISGEDRWKYVHGSSSQSGNHRGPLFRNLPETASDLKRIRWRRCHFDGPIDPRWRTSSSRAMAPRNLRCVLWRENCSQAGRRWWGHPVSEFSNTHSHSLTRSTDRLVDKTVPERGW